MNQVFAPGWESLNRRSPGLFLLGGVLLVGYATFNGIDAFTTHAYPAVENVFGPAGFTLGFFGLLGLYPRLVEGNPRLARLGAVSAGLGAAGFAVIIAANVGRIFGIAADNPPAWAGIFFAMIAIGMLLSYLLFGVSTLLADGYPRRFGLLLFGPLVVFGFMLASSRSGLFTQGLAVAISSGQALAHLAIGYTLLTWRAPTELEVHTRDMTAG